MSENHSLLPRIDNNRDEESSYDELSDNSSCESYYSDSESSIPEWESALDQSGYLLFIDCHPFTKQTSIEPKEDNFVKDKLRQSTRSKFLKLLRRRDSKRRSKRYRSQDTSQDSSSASKVTFQDYEHGEVKIVNVFLNHDARTAFGRRSTLIENLLGITVSPFPNSNRVMVAGLEKHDKIKIGDWLKTIENIEVNVNNINNVLEQFSNNETVLLHLQRVAAVEITNQSFLNNKQSKFVYNMLNFDEESVENLWNLPVGVLMINTNNLSESDSEFQDVVYAFPKPFKQNPLSQSRGLFITLNHLLNDITNSNPQITTFLYKNTLTHVVYQNYDRNVLLFMLPDRGASKREIKLIHADVIRNLEFTFGSIDRCFSNEENFKRLDHFFLLFFQRMLEFNERSNYCFENLLNGVAYMSLPNEVQMQIDDALTEMEASDYRDWNEEPLDCQRLFTILGSALYHNGYLLASHFMHDDLKDIHSYCRQQNFFNLLETESVRSLIHWREVFPTSTNRAQTKKLLDERCYILIIANNKDLLTVIMEAGGCTEPPEDNMGPDAFYVEEVEATLSHIQELGVQEFAERWLKKNTSSTLFGDGVSDERKSDYLFGKLKPNQKKTEVTSILKRRASDLGLSQTGSVFSLSQEDEFSEDSVSQDASYSERSELSDEPVVIGRRAVREKRTNFYDDNGDSDVDDYREGSQLSTGSYDLSELRQALLIETESTQPVYIGVGDPNVLYHYVQFDEIEGVLLMLPKMAGSNLFIDTIMDNFRCCCLRIRKLFQNTLRFKNMSTQDMAKSLMNKTLIAIKEHGILFEYIHEGLNTKKSYKTTYWVVGRLFYMPYQRELYVCYQDTIPQNLVDMAFKLGAN
ncbi:protein inturned [Onthophagus taurus]|uniref:protein inturned n=1 Tax=Onthophagus taurus TaxID=166361 RepID=UPI000C1FECF0|nr:protein inturned [Onthophagus taurus]